MKFVNLDKIFYLQDGSVNDGYLMADKTHLTPSGAAKVVDLLELKKRPGIESAVTPQLRSKQQNAGTTGTTHLHRNKGESGWQTVQNRGGKRRPQRPNVIYEASHSRPRPRLPNVISGTNKAQQTGPPPNRRQLQQQQREGRPGGQSSRAHIWQGFRGGAEAAPTATKECDRCLGTSHTTQECRAKNKICHKCGRLGHLERACDWY